MEIPLSHFTLYSPDELLPYWFVTHDFAEAFGLEDSSDAAKLLRRIIPSRSVRIDYEGDAVTVRISRREHVIPALSAIYGHIGWDSAELTKVGDRVMAFSRPRPRRIAIGDTFLVPLAPDVCGIGQVLDLIYRAPTVGIFTCIGPPDTLKSVPILGLSVLTILHIGGSSLYTGKWPVVGSQAVGHDPSSGPGGKQFAVGSISFGGDGPVVDLLMAHAGMRSWEDGYHDPQYLRKLVLR